MLYTVRNLFIPFITNGYNVDGKSFYNIPSYKEPLQKLFALKNENHWKYMLRIDLKCTAVTSQFKGFKFCSYSRYLLWNLSRFLLDALTPRK